MSRTGSRITRTVSAGSHFSWTVVSAGSRRSRTVSAEAKYDGQSLQEANISGLVYTLCTYRIGILCITFFSCLSASESGQKPSSGLKMIQKHLNFRVAALVLYRCRGAGSVDFKTLNSHPIFDNHQHEVHKHFWQKVRKLTSSNWVLMVQNPIKNLH